MVRPRVGVLVTPRAAASFEAFAAGTLMPEGGIATPAGMILTVSPLVTHNLTGVVSVPPSPPTTNDQRRVLPGSIQRSRALMAGFGIRCDSSTNLSTTA
ncbi:MAG: hypothetical protein QOJ42_388 [Acidobacteriaceae bacterium]|nr:hypothetical protein [Acidobacteriaceae bacterium]